MQDAIINKDEDKAFEYLSELENMAKQLLRSIKQAK